MKKCNEYKINENEKIVSYIAKLDEDIPEEVKSVPEVKNGPLGHTSKRSLNANSYMWELINKIANVLRTSKDEVYLLMLKRYSQSLLIPVIKGEKPNGYFKYYEYETESILNGKEADWYRVYKGSSEMDTKEMAILIDGVVSECKEMNIETKSENELKSLVESWS